MSSTKDEFKINGWIYRFDGNYHVIPPPEENKEEPKRIFKYYYTNENSINALLNQYLYCSHPYQLNDSLDSSSLFWNFSVYPEKEYENFLEQHPYYKSINPGYDKDSQNGFSWIKQRIFEIVSIKTGIISLTTNSLNILMWAHYSSENGFTVELDWEVIKDKLENYNPHLGNFAFIPVQYVDKVEQICLFSELNQFSNLSIPFLYSAGIKRSVWKYENEWRLIPFSKKRYGIPYESMLPINNIEGEIERKIYYPIEAIQSVVLGKNFFNGKNLVKMPNLKTKEQTIFRVKNSSDKIKDIDFLNFIISKFNDRIYMCGENEDNKILTRSREKVTFEKLEEDLFCMKRHYQVFCS